MAIIIIFYIVFLLMTLGYVVVNVYNLMRFRSETGIVHRESTAVIFLYLTVVVIILIASITGAVFSYSL
ncbi:MAG: hypothetical protein V1826_02650 [bacterium]